MPVGGGCDSGTKSEIKEKEEAAFVEEESEKHQINRIEDLIADEEEVEVNFIPTVG